MNARCLAFCLLVLLAAPALAEDAGSGFQPIFNGHNLEGWQGATDGYFVENAAIVCDPKKGGFLYTKNQYGDFHLKFEFKLTEGANNGLGIRCPLEGNPAYVGMELQIIDNGSESYKNIKTWQRHGSVYGVVAASKDALKPVGEWNQQEVIAKGKHIQVILNGQTIVDADLAEASKNGTLDGQSHPGLEREKGHFCFCGHGHRVEFRNLWVKELNEE